MHTSICLKLADTRAHEIVVRAEGILKHKSETEKPRAAKVKGFFKVTPFLIYDTLYGSVLHYFKNVNRKAESKLPFWRMRCETFRHVYLLIKVFKWVILPASLFYVCGNFYFFGRNALDSMLFGILIFVYSNFLPDLPSIYRRRKPDRNIGVTNEDLPWYKKFALMLFAPLFIGAFFLGYRGWRTTETFHNFKSLAIYVVFLFIISLFAFGDFSISIGDITEILSLPAYGLIGYLIHLKVDLCF